MDILLELHILAAIREIDGEDETRYRAGQDAVLAHYQITREQFERSHAYYHRNMEEQQLRYNTVRLRLDELSSELSDRYFRLRDSEPEAPEVSEESNETEVSEGPDASEGPDETEVSEGPDEP